MSEWVPGADDFWSYPESSESNTFDVSTQSTLRGGAAYEIEIQLSTTDNAVRPIIHAVGITWKNPELI